MKKAENLLSHTEANDGKVTQRQAGALPFHSLRFLYNIYFLYNTFFIAVVALLFVFFILKHISAMLMSVHWLFWLFIIIFIFKNRVFSFSYMVHSAGSLLCMLLGVLDPYTR